MGSLDSHILCLGSMFTQDVVVHYGMVDDRNEKAKVFIARLFVVGLLLAVFLVIRFVNARTIFSTGVWCFSAFSSLFPLLLAAIFWRRSTKVGAYLSTLSVFFLVSFFYCLGDYGANDEFSITWSSLMDLGTQVRNLFNGIPNKAIAPTDGIMPVMVILPLSALILVVGSLLSKPPGHATIERFFPGKRGDFIASPSEDGEVRESASIPAKT
jgi:SSS family solute:Na+ symporter